MIAISLSPNTERDDIVLALKVLFQPWRWLEGEEIREVERWFREYFGGGKVLFFNSGRCALYALLKVAGIGKGDEVLTQAFTCVAVVNSILWTGAKAVFVDIEKETYNLDPADLEKKISKKSKAVIVQNTFGIPAKIGKIGEIAQKHGLFLIEDCAHSLGGQYESGQEVGRVGDLAFFSFGRDKIVSSVFGGAALINPKFQTANSQKQNLKLRELKRQLDFPRRGWVMQQLLHPVLFALILPLYSFFSLGKILLFVLQKLKVLSLSVSEGEKRGERPAIFPQRFPNALAILLLHQLKKLKKFNRKRRKIAYIYAQELSNSNCLSRAIYLRYPLLVENAQQIYEKARKEGILLGRWYSQVIDPKGVDFERIGYRRGSCPQAEEVAEKILNLPTSPRMKEEDVRKVIKVIKKGLR